MIANIDFAQLIATSGKSELIEIVRDAHAAHFPEVNLPMFEYFLEVCRVDEDDEFVVAYEKLVEFGIVRNLRSRTVKSQLKSFGLIVNEDFVAAERDDVKTYLMTRCALEICLRRCNDNGYGRSCYKLAKQATRCYMRFVVESELKTRQCPYNYDEIKARMDILRVELLAVQRIITRSARNRVDMPMAIAVPAVIEPMWESGYVDLNVYAEVSTQEQESGESSENSDDSEFYIAPDWYSSSVALDAEK